MRRLISSLFLLGSLHTAAATVGAQWVRRYNGPANRDDRPAAVAVDAAGNVIVTGTVGVSVGNGESQSHGYTAKYAAATGELLWERLSAGPPGYQHLAGADALAVDSAGDVIVTGTCHSTSYD